ncbi:MAG: GNAT family N-acetyltransferase [Nanoarchaeota archaeon]|nr:GNAT family N-acetyltransferase [Nanoarchaeota archaeon]
MVIKQNDVEARSIRFSLEEEGVEIGRAFLYFIKNDLHDEPYGLMEDVYIEKEFQGQSYGSELVGQVIETAREEGCYKLICTSRLQKLRVHALYERLGFNWHGLEFRMDF